MRWRAVGARLGQQGRNKASRAQRRQGRRHSLGRGRERTWQAAANGWQAKEHEVVLSDRFVLERGGSR